MMQDLHKPSVKDEKSSEVLNLINSSLLHSPDQLADPSKHQNSQSMSAKITDTLFNLNRKGKVTSDRPNVKGLKLSDIAELDLDYWYVMTNLSPSTLVAVGHCSSKKVNKAAIISSNSTGLQVTGYIEIPCSDKYSRLSMSRLPHQVCHDAAAQKQVASHSR